MLSQSLIEIHRVEVGATERGDLLCSIVCDSGVCGNIMSSNDWNKSSIRPEIDLDRPLTDLVNSSRPRSFFTSPPRFLRGKPHFHHKYKSYSINRSGRIIKSEFKPNNRVWKNITKNTSSSISNETTKSTPQIPPSSSSSSIPVATTQSKSASIASPSPSLNPTETDKQTQQEHIDSNNNHRESDLNTVQLNDDVRSLAKDNTTNESNCNSDNNTHHENEMKDSAAQTPFTPVVHRVPIFDPSAFMYSAMLLRPQPPHVMYPPGHFFVPPSFDMTCINYNDNTPTPPKHQEHAQLHDYDHHSVSAPLQMRSNNQTVSAPPSQPIGGDRVSHVRQEQPSKVVITRQNAEHVRAEMSSGASMNPNASEIVKNSAQWYRVLISNLPKSVSKNDLCDLFRPLGFIRVQRDIGIDGEPLGTAEVLFDNLRAASRAVEKYHASECENHILQLCIAVQHQN
mmetsp:Transcript_5645/g.9933  ORF Transcript_5645/g.9933 Transcript_5645/m.9933 type:complete len:454 (-) Transcript_5645:56-1417(-)